MKIRSATTSKEKTCKWYPVCPMKRYYEQGKLEKKWIEDYCLIGNKNCVRYELEESGTHHPDYMLPNGEIRKELDT